jgi:dipeptidyl aminopeptidase/acylaminoacyl peptidase
MTAASKPYGTWTSPITADLIVAAVTGLGNAVFDGEDIYWTEARSTEGGRVSLVKRTPDGRTTDLTPAPFNVRSRVHEYGGGAALVNDGVVFFVNFTDQRIYRQERGGKPVPLTPEAPVRFADMILDRLRNRLICIGEDHSGSGEPVNRLVAVDLENGVLSVLSEGRDFYASACLSPDGAQLAWLAWDHPNMPWDGTELLLAWLDANGLPVMPVVLAGGREESIFQPAWSPQGELHFISDRSGWWNIYRWQDEQALPLCPLRAEFGEPQWIFGQSTYDFTDDGRIVCSYSNNGLYQLAGIGADGICREIELPYTVIADVHVSGTRVLFHGAAADRPAAVVCLDLNNRAHTELKLSTELVIDAGYLSRPETISFAAGDQAIAHGFYYPPVNRDYHGMENEQPPIIVRSHGGPTAAASAAFNLSIQYWTSRGFAVLDVNYRGSTGYGREYRNALRGLWGIVDVDDCVNGAEHMVAQGLADAKRLIIRGGSAGGYTTLAALAFRDSFSAGASLYGIGDLMALVADTHKFESRYLDRIIGPLPEAADLYHARSPIHHVDGLNCPVIFFQGLDDKVVPPTQAEAMVSALEKKGIPVAYLPFAGEGHGFRRAENIKRVLEAELYFYARVLDFKPADVIAPVTISNLE